MEKEQDSKTKKKGKTTMIITMGVACFALMTIMFMQFKLVNETDITSIETMREAELRTELANWKEKYEEVNQQYENQQEKLADYTDKKESNEETAELVQKELEQVNLSLGKTEVKGQGIVITIKDSDDVEIPKVQANDLLILVDSLKSAGAEAISVNEERIINMSDFAFINGSIIRVNQQRILAPYIIKAIGDPSYLESALIGNGGYAEQMRITGQKVEITRNNKITIPKYNKEITTKYIQN